MSEWLVVWGVAQAAGLVFKPILEDLAKESAKDYAKDFFKDCLKKVIHLPEKDPLKEAYGKALTQFLLLVQQELEGADYDEILIKQYVKPLKDFVNQEKIAATLGSAFNSDSQGLDIQIMARTWRDWKDDPDSLILLKDWAQNRANEDVRRAAVQELARGWKDTPGIFEFLCDRAVNDPFTRHDQSETNPRQTALDVIVRYYHDHPHTLDLLRDRADNDPDEQVRNFAKNILERRKRAE
ncbi:MAG TPA: hypothetical protein DCZ55_14205 [Cyanobacteria bacterium UBA11371]|nr:hypothetical protein [Cyanobacteria bacterium UBA11371]